MCRSIKRLRTIEGLAGADDIRAAARQFVRKVSGVQVPTAKTADVFEAAVEAISRASRELLVALPPSKAAVPIPRPRVR
ncbi:MAG TPA: DUF2277 domain-containing protein [Candidatus Limnocylindria bacterium]|nr:DUF2277 domain-containing protein [Candidatus Limnocylindria bacterium]